MDYDRTNMPENYDRGRTPPDGVLGMWMDRVEMALAGHDVSTIVDLGCGTGRFSEALAARFNANVIGVDPSEKMLVQARAKPGSTKALYAKGSAEEMPCADASTDLIFASMAFHHFRSPRRMVEECRRVLRKEGLVCIRNSTRNGTSPYERYFPNYRRALDKLPAVSEIVEPFELGGYQLRFHEAVPHMMALSVKDLAEKASCRADTTLTSLSDDDFECGLARMKAAAMVDSKPAMIDIDLFVFARGDL